mmetsp:Transcript_18278/g.32216  ORF Transcript_18278/g.32216 Transcript_18278/m.32216 type:complete len:548 (-) Transcript_18278:144-1787(-)|eukprot:CAMPEP_0201902420 /NCGR_PEP_ID=MMETSP0902-20130614/54947_1 /ASSEMBLY_ACC=CAM_ASM_000551 /TAXON_ID=420261 /ORGANISM="Thalassiosira antarctica, Strain CCMP982" /LENGTH=547 /DNA_ID=CAMNT_0048436421 /DNA_START=295 /DNA_END=1938 /DNA_ORIENTATION=+
MNIYATIGFLLVISTDGHTASTAPSDNERQLRKRKLRNTAAATAITTAAADEAAIRKLSNCYEDPLPTPKWHPQYNEGWTNGFCRKTIDCNSPGYSTELACCKQTYGGQISGFCLAQLPNPPTLSPTETGGLNVFYPDYSTDWSGASCTNTRPMPNGRPKYSTMLDCCKGAYGGQMSGKCLSMLPSPPTGSPTNSAMEVDFWYADFDTAWDAAGCSNKLPLPYSPNDRPIYPTQLKCCEAAYGGQMSGACLAQLPSPPTASLVGMGVADFWYPDYDTAWIETGCKNELPLPYLHGGRPQYASPEACCAGAYGGQVSLVCVCGMPSPPAGCPEVIQYTTTTTTTTSTVAISSSLSPTKQPTPEPSVSGVPSSMPSEVPSVSDFPTSIPSEAPSISLAPSTSIQPSASIQPSESPPIITTDYIITTTWAQSKTYCEAKGERLCKLDELCPNRPNHSNDPANNVANFPLSGVVFVAYDTDVVCNSAGEACNDNCDELCPEKGFVQVGVHDVFPTCTTKCEDGINRGYWSGSGSCLVTEDQRTAMNACCSL